MLYRFFLIFRLAGRYLEYPEVTPSPPSSPPSPLLLSTPNGADLHPSAEPGGRSQQAHDAPTSARLCGPPVYHPLVTMLVGTGIDLVEIRRIEQSLERFRERFLERVYTPGEIAYCLGKRQSAESLAARFAAKEAGAKALGTGIAQGVSWKELEVAREPGQRPTLVLHGRAAEIGRRLGVARIWLAITHGGGLAVATVHMEDAGSRQA